MKAVFHQLDWVAGAEEDLLHHLVDVGELGLDVVEPCQKDLHLPLREDFKLSRLQDLQRLSQIFINFKIFSLKS